MYKNSSAAAASVAIFTLVAVGSPAALASVTPSWVADVGAKSSPQSDRKCAPPSLETDENAADDEDAEDDDLARASTKERTSAIQRAIDECSSSGGGTLTLAPGSYKVGAIFVKSDVHLVIPKGTKLKASGSNEDFPKIWTRVAGIEMEWPAAILNVNHQHNVMISGDGTIHGRGMKDWMKFYVRSLSYLPLGISWAAGYDVDRIRNLVVAESKDVTIQGIRLESSGFWNLQVTYSDRVTIDGVRISAPAGTPSTDGIDIDSSSHVLVENCDISSGDDAIALKSGRDYDGLRVNRPTEYVVIRGNTTRKGLGMLTIGSETSGGIRHILAEANHARGTRRGLRFKSAHTRGGVVEDLLIRDTELENVSEPFVFDSNWKPSYSYASIPSWWQNPPAHWLVMATPVLPEERGWPEFRNIVFENIDATGAGSVISGNGMQQKPLRNFTWRNITASGQRAGSLKHARDWGMENVKLTLETSEGLKLEDCENIEPPAFE